MEAEASQEQVIEGNRRGGELSGEVVLEGMVEFGNQRRESWARKKEVFGRELLGHVCVLVGMI